MPLPVAFVAVVALIVGATWLVYRNAPRRRGKKGDPANAADLDLDSATDDAGWGGDSGGGDGGGGDGD